MDWLDLAKFAVATAAAVLLWSLRQGFAGGSLMNRFERLEKDVTDLRTETRQRFDRAGEEMSNLATDVQGMPDRIRGELLTELRREAALLRADSARDRDELHRQIQHLWEVVERRRQGRM